MGTSDVPEIVTELAKACIEAVQQTLDVELDFTRETLSVLDHYAQSVPEGRKAEVEMLVAAAAGAYFGEVVRRELGDGRWHCPDDYAEWRLELGGCFLAFNPLGVALDVVTHGDGEWAPEFRLHEDDRELISNALEQAGEVTEDNYYRFTTRLEVVEQIRSILAKSSVQAGKRFTHKDYTKALGRVAAKTDGPRKSRLN
jgi:hypothetical protein